MPLSTHSNPPSELSFHFSDSLKPPAIGQQKDVSSLVPRGVENPLSLVAPQKAMTTAEIKLRRQVQENADFAFALSIAKSSDDQTPEQVIQEQENIHNECNTNRREAARNTRAQQLQQFVASLSVMPVLETSVAHEVSVSDSASPPAQSAFSLQNALASPAATPFSRHEFSIIPNEGGGDCLLHAWSGNNLGTQEVSELRNRMASIRRAMPDSALYNNRNALEIAQSLFDMFGTQGEAMMRGRQSVSNKEYADFQSISGTYLGEEELIQLCRLEGKSAAVVNADGELTVFDENGRSSRRYTAENRDRVLKETMDAVDFTLYKTSDHWEKMRGCPTA